MHIKKLRLLTPGPTPLYPPAVRAMAGADIHHRTEDFVDLSKRVHEDLRYLFGTQNDIAVLASSGSGALEAAVSNLFSPGEKVLVCAAGKFGERFVQMSEAFGLEVVLVQRPYGEPIPPDAVEAALKENPDIQGVMVQATETSTGVSHDVESIAKLAHDAGAVIVVDGITGLGTSELKIDDWGLDVVCGGSQKAVMIPPGLGFMAVGARALERIEKSTQRYFYFDIRKHIESGKKGAAPWTPPTSLLLGLASTLEYIKEVGRENLIANAQLLAKATREAAAALGLELFAKGRPAGAVTAIKAPEGTDSGKIVKAYRNEFNAIIANGQGTMKGQIFRIAHLGYFDFHDLFSVIAELEIILKGLGQDVTFGSGVAATQKVYWDAKQDS